MKLTELIDFEILSFAEICRKIATGEHFSLGRFGDGEFNAILSKPGENCDGHKYFAGMGEELAQILSSSPQYYIGLHQSKVIQKETLAWIEKHGVNCKWVANSVFHDATIGKTRGKEEREDKLFDKFWKSCAWRNVSLIAPAYVFKQDLIRIDSESSLQIPGRDTYEYLDDIKIELNRLRFTGNVVLICASMTAPIIVDYLYKQYGDTATFIDFGSSFDPYLPDAPFRRSFHKNARI